MCLGTRHSFYLPPLWKKRLRIYSALFTGKNQLSSDKYIVACSFLSRIQRDIYHCSWGKGGREGEVSCAAAMCISFFFFLTPITSFLCEKHGTSILFNPFEISYMLFFFHFSVTPNVFVISTFFFYLSSHPLVFPDNIITQMEYVAGKCKVMSSSSVVATKGYYLRHTAIIFPYSALLMYIQWE